ncbi:MAG: hypothetical protein ACXWTP_08425 [Methylosarcina sp.]
MPTDWSKQLQKILANARESIPAREFCGIGVVLYSDFKSLPVLPLCPNQLIQQEQNIVDKLVSASLLSNPCHDGFHLISLELEVTHTNQYFAPPLPSSMNIYGRQMKNRGARYVSAQIGSLLPGVCCTGIVSDRDGLVIFENGREVE